MTYQNNLLASLLYEQTVKRRCFISYHHADELEVRAFIDRFSGPSGVFTHRALGVDLEPDIIESADTEYVMRRIREQYMAFTSVTIVMVGRGTWARRYVDWEIAASLRNGFAAPANGLLGVRLPSFIMGVDGYPGRLNDNLLSAPILPWQDCYARCIQYPTTAQELRDAIEQAYARREAGAHMINNIAPRLIYNRQ